jgi:AGCS family alanine or glycine:cation symporter
MFVIFVGAWFSAKLGFFQITKIKVWASNTFGTFMGRKKNKKLEDGSSSETGVSPFQAMTAALGGCVGTGTICGVGAALVAGGPGALFWMWFAALFGMMTAFAEDILAVKYRRKDKKGNFYGGPMIYMEDGLGCKWLGVLFSVACMVASTCNGSLVQINCMCNAVKSVFSVPPLLTSAVVAVLIGIIIFGGIGRIVKVTEKVSPFMSLAYLAGGMIVILCNVSKIGDVFSQIFLNAFNFRAVGGSVLGSVAIKAMRYGAARGVCSSEAGLGTSPIVHATSNCKEPVRQGMWGIFQVFVNTFIVCSITGICILITGVLGSGGENKGITLSNMAFGSAMGPFGQVFVCLILSLFAFATTIGSTYEGGKCVQYVLGNKFVGAHKIINVAIMVLSPLLSVSIVWEVCDLLNLIMMLPNLIALLLLSSKVISTAKRFLNKEEEISVKKSA